VPIHLSVRKVSAAKLAALVVVGTLALAACGDKADSTGPSSTTPGAQAKGAPVLVGLINDEQGAVAAPETTVAAKAAVAYVNGHSGVGGHPLALVPCPTNGSPESTVNCANTLINKKVAVVLVGLQASVDAAVKPLKEAGIPLFGVLGQGVQAEADQSVTYTSASQSLSFTGLFKFLKQVGSVNSVLVLPDAPAFKQLAGVLTTVAKSVGVAISYIYYNPGSPDFAAAVTAAKQKKRTDGLLVVGSEGGCTSFVKTAKQLNWGKVLLAGTCSEFARELGSQAAGVYSVSFLLSAASKATAPGAKQDQVQLYLDQMKASGAQDKAASNYAVLGFADVMTVADALKSTSGDVTAASAKTALSTYKGDVFLGLPTDCSARPSPGGSCGTGFWGLKANADGTQTVVGTVDASKG
jgi:branched-chain amino acid transport system substrate-binding protein